MTAPRPAQVWHALTASAAAFAVVAQLILVIAGVPAPAAGELPSLGERTFHLFSYFTILSNLLVLVTTASAARNPDVDGRLWRVLRLDAVVGITVTGAVH